MLTNHTISYVRSVTIDVPLVALTALKTSYAFFSQFESRYTFLFSNEFLKVNKQITHTDTFQLVGRKLKAA